MRTRSKERVEFLTDALSIAIENGGYGFFYYREWHWENVEPGKAYAVIVDSEDESKTYRVDIDTMAKGLGVISAAKERVDPKFPNDGGVLHNVRTGERLWMSKEQQRKIMLASRTNFDEGDLDAIDALAILECALFGRVVYN